MTDMITQLCNPALYPDKTTEVSLVQTHISLVFITDHFVYKVKKPVNFGFLDFSTLDKRKYYCYQELKLNRRLARDVYIDVIPITLTGGLYRIGEGEGGEVVDYAVKMRRIPDHLLMKSLFSRGSLTGDHLRTVSLVLARFHREAETSKEISVYGRPESFKVNTDENFAQVEPFVGKVIERDKFEEIRSWTNDFYKKNEDLFWERIRSERIRDCHGDLHMEHICFTEPISIIDCIEFNDRFRYSDTIADIAFLLMDLEFHGGKEYASTLWTSYRKETGEENVDDLLSFYKVYRAFVRGKVNAFQVNDTNVEEEKRMEALNLACRYFDLSYSYVTGQP